MEPIAPRPDPYRQAAPAAGAERETVHETPPFLGALTNDKGESVVIRWGPPPTAQDLEEEHRRQNEERARRRSLWGPRSDEIRGNLRELTRLLDRAIAVEVQSTDQWRELVDELHFHFPLAEAGRVFPQEFRAAAALAEVWVPKREDQVAAALEWACGHQDKMRRLYAAVRDRRRALPWRVLRPLSRLRAYEIRPHRSGYAVPAPSAATLAALPELRMRYLEFMKKIRAALSAGEAMQRWRFEQAKAALPPGVDVVGRAFAAGKRAYLGDQLTQSEVIDAAVSSLYEVAQSVRASAQPLAEYLAGTKLGTLERGGAKTLRAIGDIAAGLARIINPCIRDRRRYPRGGVYRTEVQARVVEIVATVYGVTIPPATLKTRTQKRATG